jgi:hypothetical protein
MLTILSKIRDVYLEIKYDVLGALLELAVEELNKCSERLDAEGMKHYNKVCRGLVMEREKVFEKRLNNVLMKRGY